MSGLTRRVNHSLSARFPEKRVFLQSQTGTTYLRLTPLSQLGLVGGALLIAGWLTLATAAFVLDLADPGRSGGSVSLSGDYAERLAALKAERDQRAAEALSAQHRFRLATDRLGEQQTEIFRAVEEKRELAAALEVLRERLGEAANERDLARAEAVALRDQVAGVAETLTAEGEDDLALTLETVTAALSDAVRVRDSALAEREALTAAMAEMEIRIATMTRRNEEMLAELEYAVETSFGPLEALFEATELDLDSLLAEVRRDHEGIGGDGPTVSMSTRSYAQDEIASRFDDLLVDLDRVNMMRIAAGRVPYAMPVLDSHRFTSGFGHRRHPISGRRKMHEGVDFAAPKGTRILATAEGVVTAAGREGGYGQTIRIRHALGFETVYAHNNKIHVKVGQKVSRGDHIGDMGATGRVTGVHLHYEVHQNGKPVNPMIFVEAARDVF